MLLNENTSGSFGLQCKSAGDPLPVLAGVQALGRVEGVLFELTLHQTYRNASDHLLEVVYTFPLPVAAVVMGFSTVLNGQRMTGTVVPRLEAEARYEDALSAGDAPVLLEALGNGLHTANVGNLKPGDELVVELRFAQLLSFEQGRLRLSIPTTIAPRYGNALKAGLQPQQVPEASMLVEYPLQLKLVLAGSLANAAVECPTHKMSRNTGKKELCLSLSEGATLDRDVILLVTPNQDRRSTWIPARDTANSLAPAVRLAVLQPPPAAERPSVAVKLLVDCSGSMGGDSIESARRALCGVVAQLRATDAVSFSRFGSTVEHVLMPTTCDRKSMEKLNILVGETDACLGGTEMEQALRAVFGLPMSDAGGDVLLVTDGETWQADATIAAARASGHRVFAIGVGSAPAEGVLRSLAEETGGACEFASPGEQLEKAAQRMLARMRQQPWRDIRIDWGGTSVWADTAPVNVFAGDTVLAFAGFAEFESCGGNDARVRMLAKDTDGCEIEIACAHADAPFSGNTLARMAAARRVGEQDQGAAQRAVDYQLLSSHTHCVLVHERAQGEKAAGEAELHRVSSMLAAGWGATSGVMESSLSFGAPLPAAATLRCSRSVVRDFDVMFSLEDLSDRRSKAMLMPMQKPASLRELAVTVAQHLSAGGQLQGLEARCDALGVHPAVGNAIVEAVTQGFSDGLAWLLLALWVTTRAGESRDGASALVLQAHVHQVSTDALDRSRDLFDRLLGSNRNDGWDRSRALRLSKALEKL